MKFSVSTYSFSALLSRGEYTQLELIQLACDMGFDGIEFTDLVVPEGMSKADYAASLRAECERAGITPVNYTIGADFLYGSEGDIDREIERLKGEVDIAEILGVGGMRHDATGGWRGGEKRRSFDEALVRITQGCREVTRYAKTKGIHTMMENHGFFCQESSRVERIVNGVGNENFGLLLDMGNFMCADEDPEKAFGKLLPYVYHVHAKDFIFKSGNGAQPVGGFFGTRGGNFLRGTVIGHGVVPVVQCMRLLKNSGYDGFVSVEFEGCEDAKTGIAWGLDFLKNTYESI
ncbi:MAG: sugar phosphate isomerase/epimerase [Clostridiales bacterium]|jgi:sugar phosphate isomerase/epimerase|nr:sugar phosphate isomerase/epimerase [Clostridiales bacterium]